MLYILMANSEQLYKIKKPVDVKVIGLKIKRKQRIIRVRLD